MYTKEKSGTTEDGWYIYDPENTYICTVLNEHAADGLLSHLNR